MGQYRMCIQRPTQGVDGVLPGDSCFDFWPEISIRVICHPEKKTFKFSITKQLWGVSFVSLSLKSCSWVSQMMKHACDDGCPTPYASDYKNYHGTILKIGSNSNWRALHWGCPQYSKRMSHALQKVDLGGTDSDITCHCDRHEKAARINSV